MKKLILIGIIAVIGCVSEERIMKIITTGPPHTYQCTPTKGKLFQGHTLANIYYDPKTEHYHFIRGWTEVIRFKGDCLIMRTSTDKEQLNLFRTDLLNQGTPKKEIEKKVKEMRKTLEKFTLRKREKEAARKRKQ